MDDRHCMIDNASIVLTDLDESSGRRLLNNLTALGCNCTTIKDVNGLRNLNCESFPFVHEWWIELSYVLLFSALIVLAVGGNLIVIWIVLRHRRMRTVTNYFLVGVHCLPNRSNSVFSWTWRSPTRAYRYSISASRGHSISIIYGYSAMPIVYSTTLWVLYRRVPVWVLRLNRRFDSVYIVGIYNGRDELRSVCARSSFISHFCADTWQSYIHYVVVSRRRRPSSLSWRFGRWHYSVVFRCCYSRTLYAFISIRNRTANCLSMSYVCPIIIPMDMRRRAIGLVRKCVVDRIVCRLLLSYTWLCVCVAAIAMRLSSSTMHCH